MKEPKTPKDSEVRFDPSFSGRIVGPEDSEDVWIVTGEVSGRPTLREACRRRYKACYTQVMGYCTQGVTVMTSRVRYVASPFELSSTSLTKLTVYDRLISRSSYSSLNDSDILTKGHSKPVSYNDLHRDLFCHPLFERTKKVLIYSMLLQIHRS